MRSSKLLSTDGLDASRADLDLILRESDALLSTVEVEKFDDPDASWDDQFDRLEEEFAPDGGGLEPRAGTTGADESSSGEEESSGDEGVEPGVDGTGAEIEVESDEDEGVGLIDMAEYRGDENPMILARAEDMAEVNISDRQQRLSQIAKVINRGKTDRGIMRGVEQEQRLEWRMNMIDEINELRDVLEAANVDVKRIPKPKPSTEMSDETLREILRTLKMKNSLAMDTELFIELTTTGVSILEGVCDGKHSFMGFRPNLIGLNQDIAVFLRRSKYNIGRITQDVRQTYNIGDGTHFGLRLAMIIAGRHRQNTRKAEENTKKTGGLEGAAGSSSGR